MDIRFSPLEQSELALALSEPSAPWLVAVDEEGTATLRYVEDRSEMDASLTLYEPQRFEGRPGEVDGRAVRYED